MLTFVTIVHVALCVFMIFVILLQPGKDAGMGSALGGGAATSALGGRGGATFLSKITGVCAAMFFLTSLGLSFVGMRTSVAAGSLAAPKATQQAPAQTGTAQPGAGAPPAGQIPAATPQEASPATGSGAPAGAAPTGAPTSVEQPRPAGTPAPTPAPAQ
jgi:preprotein translocase subunit SecG